LGPDKLARWRKKSDAEKSAQFAQWAEHFEEWKGALDDEDRENFEELSPQEQARVYVQAKAARAGRRGRPG
jgi:hypothetical protein